MYSRFFFGEASFSLRSSGLVMAAEGEMEFSLANQQSPFLSALIGESDGHTSQVLPMRCILRAFLELLKLLIGYKPRAADISPELLTGCCRI